MYSLWDILTPVKLFTAHFPSLLNFVLTLISNAMYFCVLVYSLNLVGQLLTYSAEILKDDFLDSMMLFMLKKNTITCPYINNKADK